MSDKPPQEIFDASKVPVGFSIETTVGDRTIVLTAPTLEGVLALQDAVLRKEIFGLHDPNC